MVEGGKEGRLVDVDRGGGDVDGVVEDGPVKVRGRFLEVGEGDDVVGGVRVAEGDVVE